MSKVPTFTYAGGVLAPGLYGRVDLNKYLTGLKVSKNFQIAVEGGAFKRWGLYYVTKPKYQNYTCKLIPWEIAYDDSYMLEVGRFYIRFIRFGGPVGLPDGYTIEAENDITEVDDVMELPTPWDETEVADLKFVFANDIAYVFHKDHVPREIKRVDLYDWRISEIEYAPNEAAPTGLTGTWQWYVGEPPVWTDITYTATPIEGGFFASDRVEIDSYKATQQLLSYKIAALMPNGLWTLASDPVKFMADIGYHRLRIRLEWDPKTDAEEYKIYKSANGLYGFIGRVEAGTEYFYDMNYQPSFTDVPIIPFEGFDKDYEDEYPRVAEFYKQRLLMAASIHQPQRIWATRPLYFNDMTTSLPAQDNDAIIATLVGRKRQTINHMIQLKKFIIFTDSGEWILEGAGGEALTPASFSPTQETAYGSDPRLVPKSIGDRVLFIENSSGNIRDMGYDLVSDAYKAEDLSRLARHLFENKRITAWDYAGFPNNLVTCITDFGTAAQMTYVREHEIWGWCEFETQGKLLDTAAVSEINQHGEYFQVQRKIGDTWVKFIERTEVGFTTEIDQMFYVDCGLTYFNRKVFTTLVFNSDTEVDFTCADHGLTVDDEIRLHTDQFTLHFIVTGVDGSVVSAETQYGKLIPIPVDPATGFEIERDTDGYMYLCTDTITGFDHLEGMTLTALADGKVVEDLLVSAGTISLPFKAAWIHAGLPYSAELQTLDLDDEKAAGRYIERAIDRVTVRLKQSRGVFGGASENLGRDLVEIDPRSDEPMDEQNKPLDGVYEIPTHTAWASTAGVIVRAPYPLPANILSIVPDITYGN
jgi:hypothetical protein